ncbi:MAG TPA: DUF5693 family protein [Abditibacteriaceae bacterium]
MNIFTHPRFRVGWLLIALSTLSSLGWTLARWGYENTLVNAQITVDYDDTKTMADAYQVTHPELLKRLRKVGVSSVALYQLSLANLRDNGSIVIQSRQEGEDYYPQVDWQKYPQAYRFLITANPGNSEILTQIYEHLREQAQPSLPPKVVVLKAPRLSDVKPGQTAPLPISGILIPASRQIINDARMGFDSSQVKAVQSADLSVVARLPNSLNLNLDRLRRRLDEAKEAGAHLVIFAEDEVLGYQSLIPMVARELKQRQMVFGAIEFSKQRGLDEMMKRSDGMLVRVHSVSGDEAAKAKMDVLVERYVRAVKDRNIRVIYVRLFPQFKGDWELKSPDELNTPAASAPPETALLEQNLSTAAPQTLLKEKAIDQNINLIRKIAKELKSPPIPFATFLRPGMVMAEAQSFRDYPALLLTREQWQPNDINVLLIVMRFCGGLGALGAFWLLLNLCFDLPAKADKWIFPCLLICLALSFSAGAGAKLMALAVGCLMTPVALLWGGIADAWDSWMQKDGESPSTYASKSSRSAAIRLGISVLVRTSLLTICGGLMTVALLNKWTYMSKTDEFLGEKATQLLPLIIVGVMMAGKIFPHRVIAVNARVARENALSNVRALLDNPFTVRYLLIGFTVLVAGYIWIARTGNDSGMDISPFELKMRAVLETALVARPRTKEFLIGNPALLLAVYFGMKRRWLLFLGATIAATIGQADLYNTMCHIHTPLLYSLLRSFHAGWIGALIGIAAIWFLDEGRKIWVSRVLNQSPPDDPASNPPQTAVPENP